MPNLSDNDIEVINAIADGTDQADTINAALANSGSTILMLPPGEYTINSAIIVPDGKTLVGAGQGLTKIKLENFTFENGNSGVLVQGSGSLTDLTVDVNKVNNGDGLSLRVNGVVATGTNFLVENVFTENATGYAFWACGPSSNASASGIFRDCVAENSNILFETNFADGVLFERCRGADGDADIVNLGVFHPLAGSNNITFKDCYYKGGAIGIDVLANHGDQRNIVFDNVYTETTGRSLGAIIHGSGTNEVYFRNTTIVAAYNNAINVNNGVVHGVDSTFISSRIAFAVYSGSAYMENSTAVALTTPDFSGATFGAYGIGSISWEGGRLAATGGPGTAAHSGRVSVSSETEKIVGGTEYADRLTSGIGVDTLIGFGGNDTYYINDFGDRVVEEANGGSDAIWTSVSYALGAGVHVETLSTIAHHGTEPINLMGNEFANALYGNAGNNRLNGGGGADILVGFGGNDSYYVDDPGDVVVEHAGGGTDTIWTSVSYVLGAGVHVDILSTIAHYGTEAISLMGNELANTLYGNAGNNQLNGGGGADILIGFGGNDSYYIDDPGDVVVEVAGGGTDTVWASVSYALGAGVHVETLSTITHYGTETINLMGNELANTLYGNAGNNRLNGGGGADILVGFGGDDSYYVDDPGDVVVEVAGGGTDTVWASVSYALGAGVHVETLSTIAHYGTEAINLMGNELANTLYGNAGNNQLNGGAGADILIGFGGNDSYYVDDPGDVVIEHAGGGSDAIWTSVSYILGTGVHVETLSTIAHHGTEAINLKGNELANAVYGNDGNNQLNGGGGADILVGFGGNDSFIFDSPLKPGNVSTIVDFAPGVDEILLDDDVFSGITAGVLSDAAFNTGSAANDADHRIIYDSASGNLYFDADGAGSIEARLFAVLQPGLNLSASDFTVI